MLLAGRKLRFAYTMRRLRARIRRTLARSEGIQLNVSGANERTGQTQFVWQPQAETVGRTRLTAFLRHVGLDTYEQLLARSNANPAWFWDTWLKYRGIRFVAPYQQVLDASEGMPHPRWCVGATTNVVLSCLDAPIEAGRANDVLVRWQAEDGREEAWTYTDVADAAGRLTNALRRLGIGMNDAVGIYLPAVPEFSSVVFAIAKLGAIAVPLFSGLGADALAARLVDVGAKAVITAESTRRRGKEVELKRVLDNALAHTPAVRHVVVIRSKGAPAPMTPERDVWWDALLAAESPAAETAIVPAEHTLLVAYTSGTTGKPKGVVHTHAGLLTKLSSDYELLTDLRGGDVLLWPADPGWLGGPNRAYGTALLGVTNVLLEGAPDYPTPDRLWQTIERHRVNIIGVSPTLVRALMANPQTSPASYDLSSLRHTCSVGEPWDESSWRWFFEKVCKSSIPILNCSGGTEIGGHILATTPHHALKPCCFGGPALAMGADIYDESGRSASTGEPGELVLTVPSIGLARGLLHDEGRYLTTYFSRYPGVWTQGDLASFDSDGRWYIHGRSDDTVKVAGKRVGPAEVEGLLVASGKVSECAIVGVPDRLKGSSLVGVCMLVPGVEPSTELESELCALVGSKMGSAFRPRKIYFVADIPRTRTAKLMRRVVQAVLLEQPPGDLSSMANPESIAQLASIFAKAPEPLQGVDS